MANLHSRIEEGDAEEPMLNQSQAYQEVASNKYAPGKIKDDERFNRYKGLRDAFQELDSNNLVELIKKLRNDEDDVVLKLEAAVDTLNSRIQTDRDNARDNVLGLRGYHRRY